MIDVKRSPKYYVRGDCIIIPPTEYTDYTHNQEFHSRDEVEEFIRKLVALCDEVWPNENTQKVYRIIRDQKGNYYCKEQINEARFSFPNGEISCVIHDDVLHIVLSPENYGRMAVDLGSTAIILKDRLELSIKILEEG